MKLILALEAGELSAPKATEEARRGIALAGGAPGINAFLQTNPKTGYVAIAFSNYDPPSAMKVGRKIGSLLKRLKK